MPRSYRATMDHTVSAAEISPLFREPHIVRGYRRSGGSWSYYLRSIFSLHNETLNIWTHVIAIIIVAAKMWTLHTKYDLLGDPYMRPLTVFMVSSMFIYFTSSVAHCLHSRSSLDHHTCFMFDYCAIGLYCFTTSSLLHFYSSDGPTYERFNNWRVPISAAAGIIVSFCSNFSKFKYNRPYPLARRLWQIIPDTVVMVWILLPIIQRYISNRRVGHYSGDLDNHVWCIIWFSLSAFFFISAVPERFYCGRFDYIGTSHQCFHVCITLSTIKLIDSVVMDIDDVNSDLRSRNQPTIAATVGAMMLVLTINCAVIMQLRRRLKTKLLKSHT